MQLVLGVLDSGMAHISLNRSRTYYFTVLTLVQTQYMNIYGGNIASFARLNPVIDIFSGLISTMYKTNMRHLKKDVGKYVKMVYDKRNEEHSIDWDTPLNMSGEAIIARISYCLEINWKIPFTKFVEMFDKD